MTDAVKATRASVSLGNLTIDGFMLPDGSYRMSQTQAAECIGLGVQNASDFLRSKAFRSLTGGDYTAQIFEIEADVSQQRGSSRINALPLEVVAVYWAWQSARGNKAALPLVIALMSESLERRFDVAFNVQRSESEWNDRLNDRIQTLERDLAQLGEAFAWDDVKDQEIAYLTQLLKDNGIEPYQVPQVQGDA
jgi:hypothetical protein